MKIQHLLTLLIVLISTPAALAQKMKAHYIDLGQADATLLEFDCGVVLIDAGDQVRSGGKGTRKLMRYLNYFFDKHPQYENTIDTVLITHNHDDHTESLNEIDDEYTIRNIVSTQMKLRNDVKEVADGVETSHRYLAYDDAIDKMPNGVFYNEVDPLKDECEVDPVISVYTGMIDVDSAIAVNGVRFRKSDFNEHPNNNSLVIKVAFGEASFIFTGDLEEPGIKYLLTAYQDHLDVLQADVYQVGHHGSRNATTKKLLKAMKPKIAVISAGHSSNFDPSSSWDHGHPNIKTVRLIAHQETMEVRDKRNHMHALAYAGQESLAVADYIDKKIYCTCWEGNVVIEADSESGKYIVRTNM